MTSTQDSPEKPKKPEDSEAVPQGTGADSVDESTLEGAILLDDDLEDEPDDLADLEVFSDDGPVSEEISEDFPLDDMEPDDFDAPELEPEVAAETVTAPEPAAASPAPEKQSAMPLVLGGLLAGGIGFAAAYATNFGASNQTDQISAITTSVDDNSASLVALTARIDDVAGSIPAAPDLSGLETGIADLQGRIGGISDGLTSLRDETAAQTADASASLGELTEQLAGLRDRIAELELNAGNADSAQSDAAAEKLAAFQAELQAIVGAAESRIVEAETQALALRSEAEAAAAAQAAEAEHRAAIAAREAALSELRIAVDTGGVFSDMIAELGEVPVALASHADTGIPTMVALQQGFAPAARAALASAQVIPDDASTGERFTAFLRRQTNARSLTPKEGDDPDAILSRAEALLSQGKLGDVLTELTALPDTAKTAMAGWITDAETRQAALLAVDSLSANLN